MMELFTDLRARAPEITFCFFVSDANVDVLLILNACQAECASRPDFQGPVITVSPNAVDHWPTPPEQLCDAVLRRVREQFRPD